MLFYGRLGLGLCAIAGLSAAGCADVENEEGDTATVSPSGAPVDERVTLAIAETGQTTALVSVRDARAFFTSALRGVPVLRRYEHFPVALVQVDSAAVETLRRDPYVLRLDADVGFAPHLLESMAVVGQPIASERGYDGAGRTIVILDTGLDYTRADFGSCGIDLDNPQHPTGATCRVPYVADTAPDDGALDDPGHGTNVAAIAAAVAPAAQLVMFDVFHRNESNQLEAASSDLLEAMDWALEHRVAHGIVAVSLSLGSASPAEQTEHCAGPLEPAFAALRAAGVLPVVATGNRGRVDGIDSPACLPSALPVGASYDRSFGNDIMWPAVPCTDPTSSVDTVVCFTNASPLLDVLAPGAVINAGGSFQAGTSQAAPHVAGAVAVLQSAFLDETIAEAEERLLTTGPWVPEHRAGLNRTYRRLDLDAATAPARDVLSVVQDGVPSSGPLDTIELVTEWTAQDEATCGLPDAFCGLVTVRSFHSVAVADVFVELTNMTPPTGREALSPDPREYGVSSTWGAWSYGDLGAAGSGTESASRLWVFPYSGGTQFTLRGRVLGRASGEMFAQGKSFELGFAPRAPSRAKERASDSFEIGARQDF